MSVNTLHKGDDDDDDDDDNNNNNNNNQKTKTRTSPRRRITKDGGKFRNYHQADFQNLA